MGVRFVDIEVLA
ncbi:hypothetical protein C5167_029943 [Papaver somniferum]|nr:hypothetical protein C5167_029943 [Papaver somniferum]